MRRIDSRTVELLPGEQQVKDQFDEVLYDGHGIQAAALLVLPVKGVRRVVPRWISAEFVEYLSDGTVTVDRAPHDVTQRVYVPVSPRNN
jgi:hypothetical protein